MAGVVVEMSADDARLFRSLAKLEAKQREMEKRFGDVGRAGAKAGSDTVSGLSRAGRQFDAGIRKQDRMVGGFKNMGRASRSFSERAVTDIKTYAGSFVGVTAAVAAVSQAYQTQLKIIKETAGVANTANNQVVAFAALQAGGTKAGRVRQARQLAGRFGVSDLGVAFDTVQALQSARGGDFGRGLSASGTVFAASRVGIPVGLGRELEVLGAAQGQKPGQAIRRAFVAGQLSSRDPAVLAGAAPGLSFFDDKDFGFAFAAGIAGGVKKDELQTFTKAGGIGLSRVSAAGFQETLAGLGVAGASRLEKLRALAGAGISTPEALKEAGLTEIRQQQAVALGVQNLAAIEGFIPQIKAQARPGLFLRQRAGIEAELPGQALTRQGEALRAQAKNALAFGPGAEQAQRAENLQLARGLALRNAGRESAFGLDLIDEEGRTTPFGFNFVRLLNIFGSFTGARGIEAQSRIEGDVEENLLSTEPLQNAADNLEQATRNLRGGPTLVRPDQDR